MMSSVLQEEENNSIQMPLAFLQQQSTTSVGSRRSVASAVQLESRPLSNGDIPSSQGGRRRRNEFKETTEVILLFMILYIDSSVGE